MKNANSNTTFVGDRIIALSVIETGEEEVTTECSFGQSLQSVQSVR